MQEASDFVEIIMRTNFDGELNGLCRILKLDEIFGKLTLPTESTVILTTDRFNLTGSDGIWSHSLVLTSRGQSTCATIDVRNKCSKMPNRLLHQWLIPFNLN
jgi:hypothetical protein